MKIPRDVSANQLVKLLSKFGYTQTRQVGSHIRLTLTKENKSFHITIPNHNPIKIGTLNSILKDISLQLEISKQELIKNLN
jgi:predicted RNA binding protein YcfA (HicA-like mRNA interferase family)